MKVLEPFVIDLPLFYYRLHLLLKLKLEKSKTFKHFSRSTPHSHHVINLILLFLQNKSDENSTSANTPNLKTASNLSPGTFFLLYSKISSIFLSISSVHDFLNCESEGSQTNKALSSISQSLPHSYSLRFRPI